MAEARRTRLLSRSTVAVVAALVVAAVAFLVGQRSPTMAAAEVGCLSAEGVISCTLPDGWDIEVPRDVGWTDVRGRRHQNGRPQCLPPTGIGLEEPVRLHWLPVEVDGSSWRQVVWVTCLS
jgi:hypothetical protein